MGTNSKIKQNASDSARQKKVQDTLERLLQDADSSLMNYKSLSPVEQINEALDEIERLIKRDKSRAILMIVALISFVLAIPAYATCDIILRSHFHDPYTVGKWLLILMGVVWLYFSFILACIGERPTKQLVFWVARVIDLTYFHYYDLEQETLEKVDYLMKKAQKHLI